MSSDGTFKDHRILVDSFEDYSCQPILERKRDLNLLNFNA